MRRRKSGFTLIELLMVVLVIGLLVVMLVPAVGAVKRAVRTSMTESRIWEIDSAIGLYKDTFGDYPPSSKPSEVTWNYPKGWVPLDPAASAAGVGYGPFNVNKDYGQGNNTPPGGQYLTYFLFGPTRFGWTTEQHGVPVNWAPPAGLERYLTKKPVALVGSSGTSPQPYYVIPAYWYFEDAFGLTRHRFLGTILYMRANTQNRSPMVGGEHDNPRFIYGHIQAQYYWENRGGSWGYTGDNQGRKNLARLLKQCPKGFALISAGANHRFGYRTKNSHGNNQGREGADWDDGISDDLCNFTHD